MYHIYIICVQCTNTYQLKYFTLDYLIKQIQFNKFVEPLREGLKKGGLIHRHFDLTQLTNPQNWIKKIIEHGV